MHFSDLRMAYEEQLEDKRNKRAENKLRLNISNHAYATICTDLGVFEAQNSDADEEPEINSEVINYIFRCYRTIAASSIELCLESKRAELSDTLSILPFSKAKEQVIDLLLSKYMSELINDVKRRINQKGHSLTFRIDTDNIEYITSDGNEVLDLDRIKKRQTDDIYDGIKEGKYYEYNVGHYFKAVIEEYAEQPYVERERIYFKGQLQAINEAIHNKKILKVLLCSTTNVGGMQKHNLLYMKPVAVLQDSERLYNYVVGLKTASLDDKWEVGAVRLTSIQNCRSLAQDAFVSNADRSRIENAIQQNGVQYLSAGEQRQKIIVEFTPEGEKLYGRILHLRPQYTKRDALIYEFDCTLQQAENYFFRYGHNVRILEPVSLAQKFCRRYQSAAKKYDNK